jgi:nucleoside-diphosphate-sugar epimerase
MKSSMKNNIKKNKGRKMSKILVTGAAGFIGSHLCEKLLKEGNSVHGIDCLTDFYSKDIKRANISKLLPNKHFLFSERDILDLTEIDNETEYVFHLAAQAGVRTSWGKDFIAYTQNNVLATQHLLELSKEHGKLKKIIYSSSSSIYGDAKSYPTKESSTPQPISPYGVTKLAGEHLCLLYNKNYGIPVVSLRYFTVFGPRQRPDMAFHRFICSILKGESLTIFGDGEQSRDFTYVDDAVNANFLAMSKKTKSAVFNIGGGNYATVNEVITVLEKCIGSSAQVIHQSKEKGDVRNTRADIARAEEELDFHPSVDLEFGLRQEISWIKSSLRA